MGFPDARDDDDDEEDHIAGVMMKRIPTCPNYNLLAPLADHLPSTV